MKLVKAEVNDFYGKGYKKTKLNTIIDEFIAMNTAVVKLDGWEQSYSSPYSCQAALTLAIKKRGYSHIKVTIKEKTPYVINKSLLEKAIEEKE